MQKQTTLVSPVSFGGIGVHSGIRSSITLFPAPVNFGLIFIRTDKRDNNIIPVGIETIGGAVMQTRLMNKAGTKINVPEHLLAALSILGVDNALISVDSEEIPILDGSAFDFFTDIKLVGLQIQNADRHKQFIVKKNCSFSEQDSFIEIIPSSKRTVTIELTNSRFGSYYKDNSHIFFNMEDREFLESEIIKARTFGWFEDRERLCKIGLARGVSEENTIIIMPDGSLYNNGLRSKNEFIAHKALDIIGDFSIMGTVIGEIRAKNPSHRLNHKMIKLCLSDRESQSCDQYHLL